MTLIKTKNINGRDDWYLATATMGEKVYLVFMSTRQGAFMEIARQLANAGYISW